MNKPTFLILLSFLMVSAGYCKGNKETFETLFGTLAKGYYEFWYVDQSPASYEKMFAAIKNASKLKREERVRFFTLAYLKFEPDGELGTQLRQSILVNNDVDYLLEHTQTLLNQGRTKNEQYLKLFVSFLKSIKKTKHINAEN